MLATYDDGHLQEGLDIFIVDQQNPDLETLFLRVLKI